MGMGWDGWEIEIRINLKGCRYSRAVSSIDVLICRVFSSVFKLLCFFSPSHDNYRTSFVFLHWMIKTSRNTIRRYPSVLTWYNKPSFSTQLALRHRSACSAGSICLCLIVISFVFVRVDVAWCHVASWTIWGKRSRRSNQMRLVYLKDGVRGRGSRPL